MVKHDKAHKTSCMIMYFTGIIDSIEAYFCKLQVDDRYINMRNVKEPKLIKLTLKI